MKPFISADFGEFVVVKAITQEDTDQFKKAEWYLRTIYDQNGDGALSKSEIKSVLMAHYEHVSEAPLDWAQLEAKASHYTDQVFKICYGEDYAWSQFNNIYKVRHGVVICFFFGRYSLKTLVGNFFFYRLKNIGRKFFIGEFFASLR